MRMDEHVLELSYKGCSFCLPLLDPDLYSTIELMRDYMEGMARQPITPPSNPTFFYKHPKSKKHIEICNDMSLLNMFKAFSSTEKITLEIKDAVNHSLLMDMWTSYEKHQGLAPIQMEEPVEMFHSSPPPATQPNTQSDAPFPPPATQPNTQTHPPQYVVQPNTQTHPPQSAAQPNTQSHPPQSAAQPNTQSHPPSSSAPAKRKHKKKAPMGLNPSFIVVTTPHPDVASNEPSTLLRSAQTSNTTAKSIDLQTGTHGVDSVRLDNDITVDSCVKRGDGSHVGAEHVDEVPADDGDPTYSDDS